MLIGTFAVAAIAATASPAALGATPPIRHVWVINLENSGFCEIPKEEPTVAPVCPGAENHGDPAFTSFLFPSGTLVANYYGIGHESLDNYIAEVSGQAPNSDTQDDCATGWGTELSPGTADAPQAQAIGQGCNFPARVTTIADQLQARGLTWKGYEEDMGDNLIHDGGRAACATSGVDEFPDSYVPKHNNFVWFHSIYDNLAYCEAHVVPLTSLRADLERVQTTPNLSFITPDMGNDGHDAGALGWDVWLPQYIRLIQASTAYRQDGLIAVIFDEAGGTGAVNDQSCCGEIPGPNSPSPGVAGPGGGDTGAVILSPYAPAGVTTRANSYNHYSLLRSLEDIFGITTGGADNEGHLGYAAGNGIQSNSSVGFRPFGCDDIFTVICPPLGVAVPAPVGASGFGLAAGPRAADGSAQWLNPGPQGNDLNSVSCSAATRCVAVGASGSVISTSTGTSWISQLSGTVSDLNGVSCPAGGKTCVAVGAGGTILKAVETRKGSLTWSAGKSGTTRDLNGVSCPTTSACYAVGAAGTILASRDGGAIWTAQSSPTTFALAQISCPATNTCYVSGDVETKKEATESKLVASFLVTRDAGAHWSSDLFESGPRSRAIECVTASWCAAGDEAGDVETTGDGQTWSETRFHNSRVLGMACFATKACVAVGDGGAVITTPDGSHWSERMLASGVDLRSVSCPAVGACYAVGRHGVVLASADQGKTWTTRGTDGAASNILFQRGTRTEFVVGAADLASVSCADSRSCVAVGNLGAILTSHDEGASWSLRSGPLTQGSEPVVPSFEPLARPLHGVSCATSGACVAVGDLGTIERSSDSGQSWSVSSSPTAYALAGVGCAPGTSTCFAVGDYGTILKSLDGGASWSALKSGTSGFLNAISCADATDCVAVGAQGLILATKDGSSWIGVPANTSAYLAAVSCPTKTRCLAVGQGATVLSSRKPTSSWTMESPPSGDDLSGVSCSSKSRCVVTGGNGTVAATGNGGASWKLKGTGTTDGLRGVSCPTRKICYAAGEYGSILKVLPKPVKRRPR